MGASMHLHKDMCIVYLHCIYQVSVYVLTPWIMFYLQHSGGKLNYEHDEGDRPGTPSQRIYPEQGGIQAT